MEQATPRKEADQIIMIVQVSERTTDKMMEAEKKIEKRGVMAGMMTERTKKRIEPSGRTRTAEKKETAGMIETGETTEIGRRRKTAEKKETAGMTEPVVMTETAGMTKVAGKREATGKKEIGGITERGGMIESAVTTETTRMVETAGTIGIGRITERSVAEIGMTTGTMLTSGMIETVGMNARDAMIRESEMAKRKPETGPPVLLVWSLMS